MTSCPSNPHPWFSSWVMRHNVYVFSNSQWCGQIVFFIHLSTHIYAIGLVVLPVTSCKHKCGWISHFFKSSQFVTMSFVPNTIFSTFSQIFFLIIHHIWCAVNEQTMYNGTPTIILQFKNLNNPNYKITSSSCIMHGCVIDFLKNYYKNHQIKNWNSMFWLKEPTSQYGNLNMILCRLMPCLCIRSFFALNLFLQHCSHVSYSLPHFTISGALL